jgi:hypothetical protein
MREVEGYEKRLTGIDLIISNIRSAAKLTWNWSRSFQVFGSHGGDAVAHLRLASANNHAATRFSSRSADRQGI